MIFLCKRLFLSVVFIAFLAGCGGPDDDSDDSFWYFFVSNKLNEPLIVEGKSMGVLHEVDTLQTDDELHLYTGYSMYGMWPQVKSDDTTFKFMSCDSIVFRTADSSVFYTFQPDSIIGQFTFRYEEDNHSKYYYWDINQ